MLILRDMIQSDIEDYVRWFTTDTEWGEWDSPWEGFEDSEEDVREFWTKRYESTKDLPSDVTRRKYELE